MILNKWGLLIPLDSCLKLDGSGNLVNSVGGFLSSLASSILNAMPPVMTIITLIIMLAAVVTCFTKWGKEIIKQLPMPFSIGILALLLIPVARFIFAIAEKGASC